MQTQQLPQQIATFTLEDEWYGIDVLAVQEVMAPLPISAVPRAPRAVSGLINVRGLIVTCIDLKTRLGIEPAAYASDYNNVIIRDKEGLICIMVDEVGDVMNSAGLGFADRPPTLSPQLRPFVAGIFKAPTGLITFLDAAELVRP